MSQFELDVAYEKGHRNFKFVGLQGKEFEELDEIANAMYRKYRNDRKLNIEVRGYDNLDQIKDMRSGVNSQGQYVYLYIPFAQRKAA